MKLLLLIGALYTLNPVTLTIYPPASMAPATIRLTVLVPRHLDNRHLCFSVDGPELKKSCFTLQGFDSRKSWTVYWPIRTAGEYDAEAILTRMTDGRAQTYVQHVPFRVLGPFSDEPAR